MWDFFEWHVCIERETFATIIFNKECMGIKINILENEDAKIYLAII